MEAEKMYIISIYNQQRQQKTSDSLQIIICLLFNIKLLFFEIEKRNKKSSVKLAIMGSIKCDKLNIFNVYIWLHVNVETECEYFVRIVAKMF